MLWHWILGQVEGMAKGRGSLHWTSLRELKKVGIKELWGEKEAYKMERFHYCYACKEAYHKGGEMEPRLCRFCPLDRRLCTAWENEEGMYVKGTYWVFSEAFGSGDWGGCVKRARELLGIKWKREGVGG